MNKLPVALLPVALLVGAGAAPAQGQPDGEILVLEEVLVVARKREESLQDVSVAVTALSADDIQAAQLNSSEDLTNLVPSLNLNKGGNPRATSFAIRGIGTQSFSSGVEPSVSTMVDGVVMGRSGQAFMQLLDVQRVEVLRGPQGTLFGKNSTAGVVHIITRDPSVDHSGEVMVSAISDDEYRAGLTTSGPLSDDLGYRFSANGTTREGYTRNYFDGNDYNGADEWSVRGKLRWLPRSDLELKWASDYTDRSCDCNVPAIRSLDVVEGKLVLGRPHEEVVAETLDLLLPVVPGNENKDVNINKSPFSDAESWGHSLEVNWDIGEYTLTSISASRGWEVNGFTDVDSTPVDAFGFDQFGASEQEQLTQELRLLSPADRDFSYVAGFFYFDQQVERNFRRTFEVSEGSPGTANSDFQVNTENWALFGEATWNFATNWRLILGARYTEDELDFIFERTAEGNTVGLPDPFEVDPTRGDTSEEDLSGKLALQWDYSDTGMAYASFTQGYKGPAFNIIFETDPEGLEPANPETSDAWELGIKTTLFDGRLRLNAALFHAVYDDFQSQAFIDPDGIPDCEEGDTACQEADDSGGFVLINAGEVSTKGFEVDFVALVSRNLRITGGVAYIDASIDEYPEGQCSGGQQLRDVGFKGQTSCGDNPAQQDLSGGDLPFSPDWKINLAASYFLDVSDAFEVALKASVRAQDDVQFSLSQDENTIQNSYAIFDASVVLSDRDEHWQATLFVKNLTDKFYATAIGSNNAILLPNGYSHRYSKLAERTFGLELRYRWF